LRSVATSLQPYVAVAYAGAFRVGNTSYVPQLELGYLYEARNGNPAVQLTAQDGTAFLLPGAAVGRGMGTVNAKVTASMAGAWSWSLGYHGLFANHLHDNALWVGFSKQF